ncbi:hypothetical protein GWK47_049616 [Chionoecetes opilio]|uniref:Uncharacterized protein n=1 Tax=Chionoecetes opilio TaxID=41210 RepID=A0A8J4Y456_CHIOP|nr:hypothetical protein GWK47_049616 [Chionoecetes opilio]
MAAPLPVVISCSRPRATCPYTAVADTGRKCPVAGRLLLGGLGISQRQPPGPHPRQSPTLPGQHALLENPHLSGLRGDCLPPQSASYIPKACSKSTYRSRHARPFAWSITPSRAPFHPPVGCFCGAIDTPKAPSPGIATSRTCRGERRSPREMVLGALRAHCVSHGTHAATRDERAASPRPQRPDTRPHQSRPSLSPAPLL